MLCSGVGLVMLGSSEGVPNVFGVGDHAASLAFTRQAIISELT
jgi:hypothetical protein